MAPSGHLRAVASPDAKGGYGSITPDTWRNEICARYALGIARYRPIKHAANIHCPCLIQVCSKDSIVPAAPSLAAAEQMGALATVSLFDCQHFEIYQGAHFERACSEQIRFYREVVG